MRITYISDSVLPSRWANAVHSVAICSALSSLGHSTRLIGMRGPAGPKGLENEVRRDFNAAPGLEILLFPLLRQRHLKRIYGVLAAVFVFRTCDLVISRNLVAAFVSVFFRRKRVVLELHEPVRKRQLSGFLFTLLLHRASSLRIVFITSALEREMSKYWKSMKSLSTVLPDGAWTVQGTALSNLRGVSNGFHVGYAGHLYPGKGAEMVIEVARILDDVQFHIVGGNPADCERVASNPNFPENVSMHGWVPPNEVPDYLASFDVLLLPNKSSVLIGHSGIDIGPWTSPLKLFEYMAAGKPIIASNLPVLREILQDRRNSLLCDPDKVSDWVASVKILREDTLLAKRLGGQARLELLSEYSWDKRAAKLVSLF